MLHFKGEFGAESFSWVALGVLLDLAEEAEESFGSLSNDGGVDELD